MRRKGSGELTYREVGATRDEFLPPGYDHVRRDAVIGHGRAAFERAADGLFHWRMHRKAGLWVTGSPAMAAAGVTVVLRAGWIAIPCRVVYTVDDEDRRGFAYGTLPGHPERGEEAFVLELTDVDTVRFTVRAFSRPASLLAQAGGPVTRLVQRYATDRYINALRSEAG